MTVMVFIKFQTPLQKKIFDPMDLGGCRFRFPEKIVDKLLPAAGFDHLLQNLFGEIHIIVDHGVAKSDSSHQLPIERIIQYTTFVKKAHSVPSAFGNHRAVILFQDLTGFSDAVLDDDLQRTPSRSAMHKREFGSTGQLIQKPPFSFGDLLAALQVVLKIHLLLL